MKRPTAGRRDPAPATREQALEECLRTLLEVRGLLNPAGVELVEAALRRPHPSVADALRRERRQAVIPRGGIIRTGRPGMRP